MVKCLAADIWNWCFYCYMHDTEEKQLSFKIDNLTDFNFCCFDKNSALVLVTLLVSHLDFLWGHHHLLTLLPLLAVSVFSHWPARSPDPVPGLWLAEPALASLWLVEEGSAWNSCQTFRGLGPDPGACRWPTRLGVSLTRTPPTIISNQEAF